MVSNAKAKSVKSSKQGPARERIVNVGADLFYRQGYRATGINQVIEESGVAKATFYNHFPTKDDLCMACLQLRRDDELKYVDNAIQKAKGPVNRFLATITSLAPWSKETDFRGCAFLNISAEIPDAKSPLRNEGMYLYKQIRKRIEVLSKELIESNRKKYGHLNIKELSDEYLIAFSGAVALIGIYHAIWPIKQAEETMRRLIGE